MSDCIICYNANPDSPRCHQCGIELCDKCYHKLDKCPNCRYSFPLATRFFSEKCGRQYSLVQLQGQGNSELQDLYISWEKYIDYVCHDNDGMKHFIKILEFIQNCQEMHDTRKMELQNLMTLVTDGLHSVTGIKRNLEIDEYYDCAKSWLYYVSILIEILTVKGHDLDIDSFIHITMYELTEPWFKLAKNELLDCLMEEIDGFLKDYLK